MSCKICNQAFVRLLTTGAIQVETCHPRLGEMLQDGILNAFRTKSLATQGIAFTSGTAHRDDRGKTTIMAFHDAAGCITNAFMQRQGNRTVGTTGRPAANGTSQGRGITATVLEQDYLPMAGERTINSLQQAVGKGAMHHFPMACVAHVNHFYLR